MKDDSPWSVLLILHPSAFILAHAGATRQPPTDRYFTIAGRGT
jgi:hypothetical protein